MADPTSDFFEGLARPGAPPLGDVTATIRIDLDHGKAAEHWFLTVDKGNISVSSKNVKADATVHADKELFDRLVQGQANAVASVLRGLMSAEGDTELLVLFQGLLPGPRASRSRQRQAGASKEGSPA